MEEGWGEWDLCETGDHAPVLVGIMPFVVVGIMPLFCSGSCPLLVWGSGDHAPVVGWFMTYLCVIYDLFGKISD